MERLWNEGRSQLHIEGFDDSAQEITTQADMKYVGQVSELSVSMPTERITPQTLIDLGEAYDREHLQTFGYQTDAPYQLVNVRVIARGLSSESRVPERLELPRSANQGPSQRPVYFGTNQGWTDTPVVDRAYVARNPGHGPMIIEEYDSTTVVPPDWSASVDRWQNILLERG